MERDRAPEYSVPVDIASLGRDDRRLVFAPDETETRRIAERLGVGAQSTFAGEAFIRRTGDGFVVEGAVKASLARICVASLEPMTETVDENFHTEFSTAAATGSEEDEFDLDAPEPFDGAIFDAGEFFVQQISLAMAPYPRKSGAASLAAAFGEDSEISPFQELADALGKKQRN